MPSNRTLTTKEIAAELRCSPETVRRLFRHGKLRRYGAYKLAPTSTIRMPRKGLDRLKRDGG